MKAGAVGALLLPVVAVQAAWAPAAVADPTAGSLRPTGPALETVVVAMASPSVRPADVLPNQSMVGAPQHRYLTRVPASEVPSLLAKLRADPRVAYADVPRDVHATVSPNDLCYAATCLAGSSGGGEVLTSQVYLDTIGAPAAWNTTTGAGVTVAVLDSGVDSSQPDLDGASGGGNKIAGITNICAQPPTSDPLCAGNGDDLGHGTHVTGILAADTNNSIGVASLGWNVRVDVFKVLDAQGNGNTADVATAIYDAVAAGVRVINMSLSNFSCPADPNECGPDPDEGAAVEYALAHNVIVVAAAGNDGFNSPTYPASYPGVLSVAATDDGGTVQNFSQWGSAANIAAPGLNIVSTWNDGFYHVLSGTSMAAPQVAAAAALMIAHDPTLSGPQITALLESDHPTDSGGATGLRGAARRARGIGCRSAPAASVQRLRHCGFRWQGVLVRVGVYSWATWPGTRSTVRSSGSPCANNGLGYWMDATDGGVFTFGDARFFGSTGYGAVESADCGDGGDADGRGYWLVASDGGIFAFGDAGFFGSTGAVRLNRPIVGMAATPDGGGYWLVASDGGIFEFGDAAFLRVDGAVRLNRPIVGMAATPDGRGYWLVASDGGIFTFGDAQFLRVDGRGATQQADRRHGARAGWGRLLLVASDGGIFISGARPSSDRRQAIRYLRLRWAVSS